jgi:hypothetical protein
MEKLCFKCNEIKPLTEFYKHNKMLDGTINKCRSCTKLDVKNNRNKKIDYYREKDRLRARSSLCMEKMQAYQKTPEGKAAKQKASLNWLMANSKKRWCNNSINNAVRDGKITKPKDCEKCGKQSNRICGHHDDYDKPLSVRWLCSSCHSEWHRINGEGENPF